MTKKEQKMVPVKVYKVKEPIDVSSFYDGVDSHTINDWKKVNRKIHEFVASKLGDMDYDTVMVPEKEGFETYNKMRIKKGKMNQSGRNYELA